jgi:hypothetical protein
MRNPDEQRIALECVRLAEGRVDHAAEILAFVTGEAADDAKAKLEAVREAVG